MATIEVSEWLNNKVKDYSKGLQILERSGEKSFLMNVLKMGENQFTKQKMLEAITTIARKPENIYLPKKTIATPAEYVRLPPSAQQMVDQAKDLMKLNSDRHGELRGLINMALRIQDPVDLELFLKDNQTGDLANRILDTDDQLAELYRQIDYCKANGKLPEPEKVREFSLPSDLTFAELTVMQRNIRSKKSKNKHKPEMFNKLSQNLTEIDRRISELI